LGFARRDGNREWNGAPSGDPCDEREHNSENDEHDDGAAGVEALVPQKNGEGTDIEDKGTDEDAVDGKVVGSVSWSWHS
jgi:hypothetical protein